MDVLAAPVLSSPRRLPPVCIDRKDMMLLHVYVHEIDAAAHPDQGAGWRWAVHSEPAPTDMASCLNAGWQADRYEALMIGEAAAVVGVRAALLNGGGQVSFATHELPEDPQPPAGLDTITVMG